MSAMFDDLLGDFDFDAPSTDFDYATKEGWREFVDFVAQRPLPITLTEYDTMHSSERALFNIARERYMTLGARVATPSLRQVAVAIRHAMADNRSPDASKSGVIISGRPGLGKTTAVQEFGRAFERARRQRAGSTRRNLMYAHQAMLYMYGLRSSTHVKHQRCPLNRALIVAAHRKRACILRHVNPRAIPNLAGKTGQAATRARVIRSWPYERDELAMA
ncbi:hypothetical protein [Microbacterium sp. C7(2022)]|uniref:hypothetical protein n=1 Tax=Microbacterium sp. C7(2022) TaxID=2992759 RepID=UPI00237B38A8|nr:hypothetical protein [Microbacterium sp. C7(2022)]MDE0546223.1 hypothetical protein [Microbacterium sp. C7(2022)]